MAEQHLEPQPGQHCACPLGSGLHRGMSRRAGPGGSGRLGSGVIAPAGDAVQVGGRLDVPRACGSYGGPDPWQIAGTGRPSVVNCR